MKNILLALCFAALPLSAGSHEIFIPGEKGFGHYGNASVEKTEKEPVPALRVRLGGLNQTRSGAAVFSGKAFNSIPRNSDLNCITLTFKGSGDPGEFVMLLRDSDGGEWCWNGVRWQGSAAISSAVDFWQKRVFRFEDFKPTNPKAKGNIPSLHKLQKIDLAIGKRLNDPAECRADFRVARIALEKDAKAGPVMEWNTEKNTEETVAVPSSGKPRMPNTERRMVPAADYPLPDWIDWNLHKAYRTGTETRNDISLNHFWLFRPVTESNSERLIRSGIPMPKQQPLPSLREEWYYTLVPGTWDTRSGTPMFDAKRNRIQKTDGISLSNFAQGWYRRALNIPEEWRGKRIVLKLDALSECAQVFLNGIPAGDLIQRAGTVELTPYIAYGMSNDLAIFVQYDGFPFAGTHQKYEEFKKHPSCGDWWFGWHSGPGLSDNVSLHVLPAEQTLEDLRIVTSVEKGELNIDASFMNQSEKEETFVFKAAVFDGEKEVLRFPEEKRNVRAGSTLRITLKSQWKDAEYWTPEHPKLYRLVFSVYRNGKIADQLTDRFGFRELTIRGADFYLNGTKRRLKFFSNQMAYTKQTDKAIREFFSNLKEMHFNGIIYESLDRRVVRIANELGLMIAMRGVLPKLVRNGVYLPGVSNTGYPTGIYLSGKLKQAREEYERTIRRIVSKFRNDPAIVIWAINPLLCYNPEWINPNLINREQTQNDLVTATLMQEAMLRNLDPSRLVMQSMGSNTGSIIAVNPYPTFSNQPDEWADWPLKWAEQKKKPLVLEEIALPFWNNFSNWENSVKNVKTDFHSLRQLYYEHAARYFGDSVYKLSSPEQDDRNWNLSTGKQTVLNSGECAVMDSAALMTKRMFLERCMIAWRMYGVSGIWPFDDPDEFFSFFRKRIPAIHRDWTAPGLKLEQADASKRPGANMLFRSLQYVQQPFLACLGDTFRHFSGREHLYYTTDTVEKTMLFSNDAPAETTVRAEWSLIRKESGTVVASGKWNGSLAPGDVKRIPFRFRMKIPGEYELHFTARSGKTVCRDTFSLTAFPPHRKTAFRKMVRLYDTNGKTAELLKRAGVPFTRDLSMHTDTIVVGALSLDDAFLKLAQKFGLEEQVRSGASLVIFAQNGESPMKPYLEERRSRIVFPRDSAHPILKGLPEHLFSYWRGEPDKTVPYPPTTVSTVNKRFMHWGSRGTVATFVQDKPDSGRFRVLLDCDADLSRTALMEYFTGNGRILFCMLDLEERYGLDPVSTELTDRLFRYLEQPQQLSSRKTMFDGPPGLKKLLAALGYPPVSVKQKIPEECELLIAGAGSSLSPSELRIFAERGGIVLLLKPDAGQQKEFSLETELRQVRLAHLKLPAEWKRGLGNTDCYFNPARKLRTFGGAEIIRTVKTGKGMVIALSVLPEDFEQNSSVVKARRILSVLLTNLGAPAKDAFSISGKTDLCTDFTGQAVPFAIDPTGKGEENGWHKPEFDDSKWRKLKIGAYWESQGITMQNPHFTPRLGTPYDGDAFYRIRVTIPPEWKGRKLFLEAGPIDDLDRTWFNGTLIGETTEQIPKYWELVRNYPIPEELIRQNGENVIAVRVRDLRYNGGILGTFRISDGTPRLPQFLFYPVPSRLIYQFDPNSWRQW